VEIHFCSISGSISGFHVQVIGRLRFVLGSQGVE